MPPKKPTGKQSPVKPQAIPKQNNTVQSSIIKQMSKFQPQPSPMKSQNLVQSNLTSGFLGANPMFNQMPTGFDPINNSVQQSFTYLNMLPKQTLQSPIQAMPFQHEFKSTPGLNPVDQSHFASRPNKKNKKKVKVQVKDEYDDQQQFGAGGRFEVDPKHLPLGTEEEFAERYPPNPSIDQMKGLPLYMKGKPLNYSDHKAAQEQAMFSGQAYGNSKRVKTFGDKHKMLRSVQQQARSIAMKSDYADPYQVKQSSVLRKFLMCGNTLMAHAVVERCLRQNANGVVKHALAENFVKEIHHAVPLSFYCLPQVAGLAKLSELKVDPSQFAIPDQDSVRKTTMDLLFHSATIKSCQNAWYDKVHSELYKNPMDDEVVKGEDAPIEHSISQEEGRTLFGKNHQDKPFFDYNNFIKLCPKLGEGYYLFYYGLQALKKWQDIFSQADRQRPDGRGLLILKEDLELPSFHFVMLCMNKRFKIVRPCKTCHMPTKFKEATSSAKSSPSNNAKDDTSKEYILLDCFCSTNKQPKFTPMHWLAHCPVCPQYLPNSRCELTYHFIACHSASPLGMLAQNLYAHERHTKSLLEAFQTAWVRRWYDKQLRPTKSFDHNYLSSVRDEEYNQSFHYYTQDSILERVRNSGLHFPEQQGTSFYSAAIRAKPTLIFNFVTKQNYMIVENAFMTLGRSAVLFIAESAKNDSAFDKRAFNFYQLGYSRNAADTPYARITGRMFRCVKHLNLAMELEDVVIATARQIFNKGCEVELNCFLRRYMALTQQFDNSCLVRFSVPYGWDIMDTYEKQAKDGKAIDMVLGCIGFQVISFKGGLAKYIPESSLATPVWMLYFQHQYTKEDLLQLNYKLMLLMLVFAILGSQAYDAFVAKCAVEQKPFDYLKYLQESGYAVYAKEEWVKITLQNIKAGHKLTYQDVANIIESLINKGFAYHPLTPEYIEREVNKRKTKYRAPVFEMKRLWKSRLGNSADLQSAIGIPLFNPVDDFRHMFSDTVVFYESIVIIQTYFERDLFEGVKVLKRGTMISPEQMQIKAQVLFLYCMPFVVKMLKPFKNTQEEKDRAIRFWQQMILFAVACSTFCRFKDLKQPKLRDQDFVMSGIRQATKFQDTDHLKRMTSALVVQMVFTDDYLQVGTGLNETFANSCAKLNATFYNKLPKYPLRYHDLSLILMYKIEDDQPEIKQGLARTMLSLLSMPPQIPEDHQVPSDVVEIDYNRSHSDLLEQKWTIFANMGQDAVDVFDNLGTFFFETLNQTESIPAKLHDKFTKVSHNKSYEFVGCSPSPTDVNYREVLQAIGDVEHNDARYGFYTPAGLAAFDETIDEARLDQRQFSVYPRSDPDVNDIIENRKAEVRDSKQEEQEAEGDLPDLCQPREALTLGLQGKFNFNIDNAAIFSQLNLIGTDCLSTTFTRILSSFVNPGEDPFEEFTDEVTRLINVKKWALRAMDRLQQIAPDVEKFKDMRKWYQENGSKILTYETFAGEFRNKFSLNPDVIIICPIEVDNVTDLQPYMYPSGTQDDFQLIHFRTLYTQNRVNLSYAPDFGQGQCKDYETIFETLVLAFLDAPKMATRLQHPRYFSSEVAEKVLQKLDYFRGFHEGFSQVNHYMDALKCEVPYNFSTLVYSKEDSLIPSGLRDCDFSEQTSTAYFTKKSIGPPQPQGTYENEDDPLSTPLCAHIRSQLALVIKEFHKSKMLKCWEVSMLRLKTQIDNPERRAVEKVSKDTQANSEFKYLIADTYQDFKRLVRCFDRFRCTLVVKSDRHYGLRFQQDRNDFLALDQSDFSPKLPDMDGLLEFDDDDFNNYLWMESDFKDQETKTCKKGDFLEENVFKHEWLLAATRIKNYKPELAERRNEIKILAYIELTKEPSSDQLINMNRDYRTMADDYLRVFLHEEEGKRPVCTQVYLRFINEFPNAESRVAVTNEKLQDLPLVKLDYGPFVAKSERDSNVLGASQEIFGSGNKKAKKSPGSVKKKGNINDMIEYIYEQNKQQEKVHQLNKSQPIQQSKDSKTDKVLDKKKPLLPKLYGSYHSGSQGLVCIKEDVKKMLWYFKQQDIADKEKLRLSYEEGLLKQPDELLELILLCSWKTCLKILSQLLPDTELTAAVEILKEGKTDAIEELWNAWKKKEHLEESEFKDAWIEVKDRGVNKYLETFWKDIESRKDCPDDLKIEVTAQRLHLDAYSGVQSEKAKDEDKKPKPVKSSLLQTEVKEVIEKTVEEKTLTEPISDDQQPQKDKANHQSQPENQVQPKSNKSEVQEIVKDNGAPVDQKNPAMSNVAEQPKDEKAEKTKVDPKPPKSTRNTSRSQPVVRKKDFLPDESQKVKELPRQSCPPVEDSKAQDSRSKSKKSKQKSQVGLSDMINEKNPQRETTQVDPRRKKVLRQDEQPAADDDKKLEKNEEMKDEEPKSKSKSKAENKGSQARTSSQVNKRQKILVTNSEKVPNSDQESPVSSEKDKSSDFVPDNKRTRKQKDKATAKDEQPETSKKSRSKSKPKTKIDKEGQHLSQSGLKNQSQSGKKRQRGEVTPSKAQNPGKSTQKKGGKAGGSKSQPKREKTSPSPKAPKSKPVVRAQKEPASKKGGCSKAPNNPKKKKGQKLKACK